jgi:hypothetical protein
MQKNTTPSDFLTTPSTPLKRIFPKNPRTTPCISNYCESIPGVANLFSGKVKKRAGKTLEGIFYLEN